MKRKILFNAVIMALFLTGSLVSAGGKHKHDANVIKLDAKGHKVALCACGQEVNVTDSTPKVVDKGQAYYLCSDKCKAYFSKNAAAITPALHVKVLKAKAEAGTLGNVYKVDDKGAMVAKCGCGMDIQVTDKSLSREHDGQTFYLCSDACAAVFDKDANKVIHMAKTKIEQKKK